MSKTVRTRRKVFTGAEDIDLAVRYAAKMGIENFKEIVRIIKNHFLLLDREREEAKRLRLEKANKTLVGRLIANPATAEPLSLDFEYGEGDDALSLLEGLVCEEQEDLDKRLSYGKVLKELFESDTLDKKERIVLMYRFGYETDDHLTLIEVGERLGVSRERIRQIEERAFRKARHFFQTRSVKKEVLFI